MNIYLQKKYRKRRGAASALLTKNPVLVLGLDLPFVIACATSLRTAVALSIEMFIIHMVTMVAALITVRHLPMWQRVLVNGAVSTVTMTAARWLITMIFPDLSNFVGMYVYLMAVNGITIYQANSLGKRQKPWPVMVSAFMNAVGFALIMVVVAAVRELFGNGTVWGMPVGLPVRLSGILMPFCGFLIMGLLLAFAKFLNKKLLAYQILEAARRDARFQELR